MNPAVKPTRTKIDAVRCPHCGKVWVPRVPGPWRCSRCWRIVV